MKAADITLICTAIDRQTEAIRQQTKAVEEQVKTLQKIDQDLREVQKLAGTISYAIGHGFQFEFSQKRS